MNCSGCSISGSTSGHSPLQPLSSFSLFHLFPGVTWATTLGSAIVSVCGCSQFLPYSLINVFCVSVGNSPWQSNCELQWLQQFRSHVTGTFPCSLSHLFCRCHWETTRGSATVSCSGCINSGPTLGHLQPQSFVLQVSLGNNPWQCNCELQWLHQFRSHVRAPSASVICFAGVTWKQPVAVQL